MNYTDQQIAQMLGRDITTVIYYSKPYLMKKQINLFSIYLIKYDSKAIWAKTVQSYKKSMQLNSIVSLIRL